MTEGRVVTKKQEREGKREVGKESEKQEASESERRKSGWDGGEQEWERGKGGGKI